MTNKEKYFHYSETIAKQHKDIEPNIVLRTVLDFYFSKPWEKKLNKPALLNLSRKQLSDIILFLEKMQSNPDFFLKQLEYSKNLRK